MIGSTAMSDLNEDHTVAFEDPAGMRQRAAAAGLVDVPKARLICTDRSQVESALPGEGVINLEPGAEHTVGRGDTCTYPIVSRKLSRQHARVFAGVGAWGVEDLNSTNGIRVNEEKVQTAWLKHGDVVRFGPIPFRFEVERPDIAAARPVKPAASSDGDGEHTMIFTGAQGAKAAAVMIKAVREAEKGEEPPAAIVPTTPTKATRAAPVAAKAANGNRTIIIAAAAVAVALVIGGIVYYPTFSKGREISAILNRDNRIADRVITRSRELVGSGTAGSATADAAYQEDANVLNQVVSESKAALASYPDSRELANLYARASFLIFERGFAKLFNRTESPEESLRTANIMALELRSSLDRIASNPVLAPLAKGGDSGPLKESADLADLASIMVKYREFSRKFSQFGKPDQPTPTLEQLNELDKRKKEFIQYTKLYHQILTRDFRLFNAQVTEVENRDFTLVGRWREFLNTGR